MRDLELPDEMSGLQGFRRRWRQAVSTSDPIQDSIENLNDCAEYSNSLDAALDAVSALEESDPNDLLVVPLDSVSVPEVLDDEPPFSLVDDVISKDDTPPHTLMVATAKSKPQPVVDTFVSNPQGIKRTADELSARVLHERMSKMKQPWQQGPLSSLFSQPKNIWQRDTTVHCIGMYDHLSIDDGTSAKPKAASSSVLGKQRIRTARMINDEDDFRRVALGRFKTMILVDLNSTRLGKSLQTFAGTLCTNDELSQFSAMYSHQRQPELSLRGAMLCGAFTTGSIAEVVDRRSVRPRILFMNTSLNSESMLAQQLHRSLLNPSGFATDFLGSTKCQWIWRSSQLFHDQAY